MAEGCADSLDADSYSPIQRVHQLVLLAPHAESIATMPTKGSGENVSLVPADYTISGGGGMLVLQAAEPDNFPVPPGDGTSKVTSRLCLIVGVAMLIAGGLVWFLGTRQSANFPTTQIGIDPFQMMVNAKKQSDETPRQVAKNIAKDEVQSTTEVKSPVAESDLAATIGKPIAAAPSLPAPEEAAMGGTPKQTSQPVPAPVSSGPVSQSALPSGTAGQLDNTEIALLVRRGKDFLKDGDLVSARLLFQRAAAAGNAEAAFILGTTFDPLFIHRMGVVGMESDVARAREWYKRAAELGSTDASQQLATLQQRY